MGDSDLTDIVRRLVLTLVPMILSLSVHEWAHAFSAYRLGDPTARDAGRLTLNPQVHIDPLGTIIIPALGVIAGGIAFIGWARPTPFRAEKFRPGVNRRLGSAIVAAAGPISNVVLAILAIATMAGIAHVRPDLLTTDAGKTTAIGTLLYAMFTLNVGLAIFNLLPIPPLDGHRLLPPAFDAITRPLERFGFAILMGIFMFLPGVASAVFYRPMHLLTETIAGWFGFAI